MKILQLNRGKGKTTELVKLANKEWKYIICSSGQRADFINETAMKLGLDIPYPITLAELPLRSPYITSVLIDDVEDILQFIIGKPIDVVTTSSENITKDELKDFKCIPNPSKSNLKKNE